MAAYLEGSSIMVLDWAMFGIAFALVATRIWFRLFRQRSSLRVSDCFVLLALFFAAGLETCLTMQFRRGGMVERVALFPPPTNRMIGYASTYFYYTSLYCAKFSILGFYYSLIPPTWPRLRIALVLIIFYTAGCFVTAILLTLFWCGIHLTSNFVPSYEVCSIYNPEYFNAAWAMNISSDIMIFVLPFPLLTELRLARRQIAGLLLTFGLGLITISVSTGRFVAVHMEAVMPLFIWSVSEVTTAIMVVSLPELRPLLRRTAKPARRAHESPRSTERRSVRSASSAHTRGSAVSWSRPHSWRRSFSGSGRAWAGWRESAPGAESSVVSLHRWEPAKLSREAVKDSDSFAPLDAETGMSGQLWTTSSVFDEPLRLGVLPDPEDEVVVISRPWRRRG